MGRHNIPIWINILSAVVVLILVFKTYAAFLNPSLAYGEIDGGLVPNQRVLWELAGRNLAMLAVTLLALGSQNARYLTFTMIMNLVRESFDMMMALRFSGGDMTQIAAAFSFLIFLVPYYFALVKLRAIDSNPN